MQNFNFYSPTRILFGQGQVQALGEQVRQHGSRILLVYGKSSIKRTGIYDAVVEQLNKHNLHFVELPGVDPNPRLTSVVEGAALCRTHELDLVLAVGGGSVIDCAKGIAVARFHDGDPWDFWAGTASPKRALPVGVVLTLAATGSEMNNIAVLTNEDLREKCGLRNDHFHPAFSILDPTFTFTVPKIQTASSVADALTHVYESYFTVDESAWLQDRMAEAVMTTIIRYGPVAYAEPENYEARANLMWASTMALNGVVSRGKEFDGFNHLTEHAISAIYDLTHGIGLAILAPHWMEYTLNETTAARYEQFARAVWGVTGSDTLAVAREGIARLRAFYRSLGLPGQLSEVGIGDEDFDEIADKSLSSDGTQGHFVKLARQDILNILNMAK